MLSFFNRSNVVALENLNLQNYLLLLEKKHSGLKAIHQSKELAKLKENASDLALTPTLSLKNSILSDKKLPNTLTASESKLNQYSASLNKKFATGTSFQLFGNSNAFENVDITSPAFSSYGKYGQGG